MIHRPSFLGFTSWYSKFIPNYTTLVEPLCALLYKSTGFRWTDEAQEHVRSMKHLITASEALALFDPFLSTIVSMDALDYCIGTVLTHVLYLPCIYCNWYYRNDSCFCMSVCERKYSTTEMEP